MNRKLHRFLVVAGLATSYFWNNSALAQTTVPQEFIAVDTRNHLMTFDTVTTIGFTSEVVITGLNTTETLVGIDFQPSGDQLFGVGETSRLYTINRITGVATEISDTPFSPPLTGDSFAVDFDASNDTIRVIGNTGYHVSLRPSTGKVKTVHASPSFNVGDPNQATPPTLTGLAFSRKTARSSSGSFYVVDTNLDLVGLLTDSSAGLVQTIGSLGLDATNFNGFDIAFDRDQRFAWAGFELTGNPNQIDLYRINLQTGAAENVRNILPAFFGASLRGLTAVPDNDGDGVLDGVDDCPDTDIGLFVTPDGCPLDSGTTVPQAFVASDNRNHLLLFDTNTTLGLNDDVPISGLQVDELVRGIDYRPATGQLYGLGSTNRIYIFDPVTGAATAVSDGPFAPPAIGEGFGFDFDPSSDLIRIVSNTGYNATINPNTGKVKHVDDAPYYSTTGGNAGQTPFATGIAYSKGGTRSLLYVIESNLGNLGLMRFPSLGTIDTIGFLSVPLTNLNGFDIVSNRGFKLGFAAMELNENPGTIDLYAIVLKTGGGIFLRNIISTASNVHITGLTAVPDDDGDGVIDGVDQCPKTPFGLAVTPNGCPPINVDYTGIIGSVEEACGTVCKTKVQFTLFNNGTTDGVPVNVDFFVSPDAVLGGDTPLGTVTVKAKADSTKKKRLNAPSVVTPLTNQFIIAVIDQPNAQVEFDEGNNVIVFGPLP